MANQLLDANYVKQVQATRDRIQAFALSRFRAGQFRDADMARFVSQVVPVVLAGRRQVSALTDSYLAQVMSKALGVRVPALGPIDTSALRGVPAANVYERPFVEVRTKLAQGMEFATAVDAGASRLWDLVATDMQMAKTYTAQDVFSNSGDHVVGYERIPTGANTCALCMIASTQRYHRDDLMPIHPGCNCDVGPIIDNGTQVIYPDRYDATHQAVQDFVGRYDTNARDVGLGFKLPDGTPNDYRNLIIVHDHGEIGPVLGIRGQNFDGPSVVK